MNTLTNYLEKLGSNFLVASMVPSLALVLACLLVFDPILQTGEIFRNPESTAGLIGLGMIIFVLTVIIGYTLTALNTYILKMLEGYVIPWPLRPFYSLRQKSHLNRARRLREQREELQGKILELEKQVEAEATPDLDEHLEQLHADYYRIAVTYDLSYPEDLNTILPTRFGNQLKAAENYPGERFGMDGVLFWPRLMHVIPQDYKSEIEAARNELSFLANMSILAFLFSLLCMLAIFGTMATVDVQMGGLNGFLDFLFQVSRYLISMIISIAVSAFFYNASLYSVGSFGLIIRASYDLFRLDLFKKMGLKPPKNSIQEFKTWRQLNELVALGRQSLSFKCLNYREDL